MEGGGWFGIGWQWWILYFEIPIVAYAALVILGQYAKDISRATIASVAELQEEVMEIKGAVSKD